MRLRVLPSNGWAATFVEGHGIFVTHLATKRQLHVRPYACVGDEQLLRTHLADQRWGAPALDVSARTVAGTCLLGGTFVVKPQPPYFQVREWFISNGTWGANAWLPLVATAPDALIEECERMLETIEVEP